MRSAADRGGGGQDALEQERKAQERMAKGGKRGKRVQTKRRARRQRALGNALDFSVRACGVVPVPVQSLAA